MDLGGDFGPAAVAVDAGVSAHGAKDGVGGEFYVVDCFDEGVEGGVQIFAAFQENAGRAGVPVDGAVVGDVVVLGELPGGAPVEEFFFDGFALGMVADDAFAAMPFEDEHLKLLLQPPLTVDAMGFLLGLLEGVLSGGFRGRFRGHFGLSFCEFAGRRTRARCGEVGDRSIFVRRPLLGKGRRPTFVQSPISYLLIGLLACAAI